MIARLFKFHGGVKPKSHKDPSSHRAITAAPLPPRLAIPLRENIRSSARCLVQRGQKVLKGERIGEGQGPLGVGVHASTSGTVVGIAPHPLAHASGLDTLSVFIEPDGADEWIARTPFDHRSAPRDATLAYLAECGIAGMGGAAFPTHIKLGSGRGVDTLVINGAECEPWITCDDRLMRERADEILAGAAILRELIGAKRILVGIEDNKPEALDAMRKAAAALGEPLEVIAIPTLYPAGGEKQLIRVLTGIEIPYGKLGAQFGVQCFNVGTARAVFRAIRHGEPLVSRVVTLTGNVECPGNFEVPIGTPVDALLPLAGPKGDTDRYLMGGPMMGVALADLSVAIAKGSNCVIAGSPALFPPPPPELPCIRCGACAQVCPVELQPFELYWFSRAKNFGKAQEYHLFDCIECGSCAFVCPSHIPLVDYFRFAKSEIWAREREVKSADQARERFEFRNFRQAREREEKAARLAAKAAETRAKLASQGAPGDAAAPVDDPKKALIAAALERARQQKAAIAAGDAATDAKPAAAGQKAPAQAEAAGETKANR